MVTSRSRTESKWLRQWRLEWDITSGADGATVRSVSSWWVRCMPECCGFFSSVQSRLSMTELLVHDFLSKYMCIPEHLSYQPRETAQQLHVAASLPKPWVLCFCLKLTAHLCAPLISIHQEQQACFSGHSWGRSGWDERRKVKTRGL